MSTFWNLYKAEKENVQVLLFFLKKIKDSETFDLGNFKNEYVILIFVRDFEKWLKLKKKRSKLGSLKNNTLVVGIPFYTLNKSRLWF